MGSTVIETVLHSTLEKSRKKLMFAAVKANAFYAYAMANDKVEYEHGGREISNPLIVGRNPNVTSYEYYDELPVARTNEFDTVRYGWARVAGSVIISDQEIDENRGETEIFKILKGKMQVLEESIKEKFQTYLYGAGTGKDPNGLALLVPDNPETGVVGGIDRATEKQWRTMAKAYNGSLSTENIEEEFDDILLDMKQGKNEKPDLILCGRNIYKMYRKAVRDKISILADGTYAGKKMYDLGFDGVSFGGITMIYDEDCPADKAYFLNTTYLRMHVLSHVNMKVKELSAPWVQDVIGRRIVWQGQMCLWKADRTQCVVNNASA
jgi:hypothetical protein